MSIIKLLVLLISLVCFALLMGYHTINTTYTTVRIVCIMFMLPTVGALYITIYDTIHYKEG